MDVRIKATNFDLTAAINDYTEDRLMTIRHMMGESNGAARCEVELGRAAGHSKSGYVWFAEINLYASDGGRFFAREEAESINAAIDAVKDEILSQMRKEKKVGRGAIKKSGALLKKLLRRE